MRKLANTAEQARAWVEFLAARPEVPWGQGLIRTFNASTITRLCDCGCNSFDLSEAAAGDVEPLMKPGDFGAFFEIAFEATGDGPPEGRGSLEFIFYARADGHLAGVEIDFCGNSYPVPESLVLADHPYHVAGASVDA